MLRLAKSYWMLVILVVGCLLYLPFLGQRQLFVEEGRRALQVVALLNGGSWWQLDVGGALYVAQPPMLPWLMALSSFITGGINEWAVRLPSVISVIVAALASGGIASVMAEMTGAAQHKRLAALAGGLAFLTCPSIIERARVGETDMVETASVALAFLAFFIARSRNQYTFAHWLGIGAPLAVGALAKGPIPVAFVAVPILMTFALDRDGKRLVIAVAVLCAALAPLGLWAYLNMNAAGDGIWAAETRVSKINLLLRLEGLLPLLYLNQIPRWLVGMMPWSALAAIYVWQRRKDIRHDALLRAVLLYAIPVSVVVLLWPGARGRYALRGIVPVMALTAVFTADQWASVTIRRVFAVSASCLAVVALGMAAMTGRAEGTARFRANVSVLQQLIQERAVQRIHFIDMHKVATTGTIDAINFLAYARRPVRIEDFSGVGSPSAGDMLILGRESDVAPIALRRWKPDGMVGTTGLRIYFPGGERSSAR